MRKLSLHYLVAINIHDDVDRVIFSSIKMKAMAVQVMDLDGERDLSNDSVYSIVRKDIE
jgi:hypothetical protein